MRKDDVALGDPASPGILVAPFVGKPMPLGARAANAGEAHTGHHLHSAIHVALGSLSASVMVTGNVERRQLEPANDLECRFERWQHLAAVRMIERSGCEIAHKENCGGRSLCEPIHNCGEAAQLAVQVTYASKGPGHRSGKAAPIGCMLRPTPALL
jgi:hypothetical protein